MSNQLKTIQNIQRNILQEFIRICDKHGLRYFLVEGSLLGAIRHQGMIPWDDDIDVALFREDYEKFLQIAQTEVQKPYALQHYSVTNGYIEYIAQLIDTTTCIETPYRRQVERKPLWIDIFVIDGFPASGLAAKFHKARLLYGKLMMMWSNMDHFVVQRPNRPLYERVLIRVGDALHTSSFLSTEKQLKKVNRIMKSCRAEKSHNTVNFMSEYKWRTVFPADWYGEGRMVPFEDFTVRIPNRAEDILTSIYGDYMQLPPEHLRYKHSITIVSLEENQ